MVTQGINQLGGFVPQAAEDEQPHVDFLTGAPNKICFVLYNNISIKISK